MQDWRARLEHWIRVWDRLPEETRHCFGIHPPLGAAWPEGLATCTALSDLYARCNGGTFGSYGISQMAYLSDPSGGWLAHRLDLDLKPSRWLEFGGHDYGHALWWDADADEVMLCIVDNDEPEQLGQTMEEFLTRLFFPPMGSENEEIQFWAAALAEADKLAS